MMLNHFFGEIEFKLNNHTFYLQHHPIRISLGDLVIRQIVGKAAFIHIREEVVS